MAGQGHSRKKDDGRPVGVTSDRKVRVVGAAAVEERLQAARAFVEGLGPAAEVLDDPMLAEHGVEPPPRVRVRVALAGAGLETQPATDRLIAELTR